MLRKHLSDFSLDKSTLYFSEHHLSHAASAFYPSPFRKAAVLCLDGVGEWATSTTWLGDGKDLKAISQINYPHSLGLLYSAFTYYCGFKVNSGEYKLMGLAPLGKPKYVDLIMENLVDVKEDGSFYLNLTYFNYTRGLTMINEEFENLFGHPKRTPESLIDQFYKDVAASIQHVTETIILKMVKYLKEVTQVDNLCMAGGVALNCVVNGKIRETKIFKSVWVQPAAGDAGGALGAALALYYNGDVTRKIEKKDSMKGALLGPMASRSETENILSNENIKYKNCSYCELASLIEQGSVVGFYTGRMEFGPRALGSRSIIANAKIPDIQKIINLKIKKRESFRPFAPIVLAEDYHRYFVSNYDAPYMQFTDYIQSEQFPGVTHVDGSCRVQSVSKEKSPEFYQLLNEYKKLTGESVLINTSFNVRGEPIVCSVKDAISCFMRTDLDYIFLNGFLVDKKDCSELQVDEVYFGAD